MSPAGSDSRASPQMPTPGDALLIGLNNAVPSCAVLLRLDCRVSGVGVDPNNPPYVWEAWTGGPIGCHANRNETRPRRSTSRVTSSCTCRAGQSRHALADHGHTPGMAAMPAVGACARASRLIGNLR